MARPSTWVAVTIVSLAVIPAQSADSAGGTPSDLALGIAALLAIGVVLRGRQLAVIRSVPAVGFLTIGVLGLVATAVAGNFPQNVVGGLRFVELFLLAPVAVMVALRTRTDAFVVLGSLVGLAFVEGSLGLVQYVTGTGAGIGAESVRAVGTFGAYNIGAVAHITALGFLPCLAVAVVQRGALRSWAVVGAAVLLVANLAALSRGAWVAVAVAALVVVSRGRPRRLLATVAILGIAAAVVVPSVASTGSKIGQRAASLLSSGSAPDQSLIDREALWRAATQMALDHPLTGVGPRGFADHRDAYADFSLLGSSDISFGGSFQQIALKSPHSMYLLVASEQGLIAAGVLLTVLLVVLARGLVRAARRRTDLSTTVALMGAGLLSFELVSMVTGDLGGRESLLTGVALGLAGWAAADVDLPAWRAS